MSAQPLRDCLDCLGTGGFREYASEREYDCERCDGNGQVPLVCPDCTEAEISVRGTICDLCLQFILEDEAERYLGDQVEAVR